MQHNKLAKNGWVNMALFSKKLFFIILAVFFSYYSNLAFSAPIQPKLSPRFNDESNVISLNKMRDAIINKNYRVVFINSVSDRLNIAFEYTHALINNQPYAKLLYLEGPPKQIILNDNVISYYQQDYDPFSIKSHRIIEAFPNILFNDFEKLNALYDYVSMGKGRVANRPAQLIRILPKDKDRNNYILWLDEKSFMPLRIDLYDINHRLLEQFKVVSITPLTSLRPFLDEIKKVKNYPILAASYKDSPLSNHWKVNWVPNGFMEKAHSQINAIDTEIDTRLYSDGVFSFTVTISDNPLTIKSYSLQSGNQIIYVTHFVNKEVTIIGDLPLETIKKIAEHIEIKA